jgi:hypothetical protein
MRGTRILVAVVLVMLAIDIATPTAGAFCFDDDESILGLSSEARADVSISDQPDFVSSRARDRVVVVRPRVRPASRVRRAAEASPARAHLLRPSESDRITDDH